GRIARGFRGGFELAEGDRKFCQSDCGTGSLDTVGEQSGSGKVLELYRVSHPFCGRLQMREKLSLNGCERGTIDSQSRTHRLRIFVAATLRDHFRGFLQFANENLRFV